MKVPWNMPKKSYNGSASASGYRTMCRKEHETHFDQYELVKQHAPTHVGESYASHDDQGSNHEALRPCFND